MKTLYAVPWIEVEYGWGSRPEGFMVYDNLDECIEQTKLKSEDGNYDSGYFGPERPLGYYETPDEIEGPFPKFIDKINFKSTFKHITR
jgi:hypothetical protein